MRTAPYIFALLFMVFIFYLGLNNFEFPTLFIFDKTEKTKGTVTNTDWTYGVKGSRLQQVTYEFEVNDSIYTDRFKAGQRQGLQEVGDQILIEYSVNKPEKNEVVGYYRKKSTPIRTIKLESKK